MIRVVLGLGHHPSVFGDDVESVGLSICRGCVISAPKSATKPARMAYSISPDSNAAMMR